MPFEPVKLKNEKDNYWKDVLNKIKERKSKKIKKNKKSENKSIKEILPEKKKKKTIHFKKLIQLALKDQLKSNSKSNRDSIEYKAWRQGVFERDNFICVHCQEGNKEIIAHHIKEWSQYPNLRFKCSNGKTLCTDCHAIYHIWLSESTESQHLKSISQECH